MARIRTIITKLTESDEHSLGGKLLRLPLTLIPDGSVMTVRGGINKGARWISGSSLHSCWMGTYEAEKQDLVPSLVRPGMTVWDVGANAGFYTLAFSRLVGDSGQVYAFEPYAENADNILAHIRLNSLKNTVLIQAAVGRDDGLVAFQPAALNAMGRVVPGKTAYLVPSLTVDGFIRRNPSARPDMLKVDVEGAEADLLEGAQGLLAHSAPVILLAVHGENVGSRCYELLRRHGYSIYYLDGSAASSLPLRSDEVYAVKEARDTGTVDRGAST